MRHRLLPASMGALRSACSAFVPTVGSCRQHRNGRIFFFSPRRSLACAGSCPRCGLCTRSEREWCERSARFRALHRGSAREYADRSWKHRLLSGSAGEALSSRLTADWRPLSDRSSSLSLRLRTRTSLVDPLDRIGDVRVLAESRACLTTSIVKYVVVDNQVPPTRVWRRERSNASMLIRTDRRRGGHGELIHSGLGQRPKPTDTKDRNLIVGRTIARENCVTSAGQRTDRRPSPR